MINLLLAADTAVLELSIIVLGIIIAICSFIASIMQIIIIVKYMKYNRKKNKSGFTAFSACRNLLDSSGMTNVKVEQCSWLRAFFYGNSYSRRKKTIFLRKNIINNSTVTAVGIGLQKVGLAIQDRDNDKKFIIRAKLQPYALFAPIMFVPIILVGMALDYFVGFGGISAIISIVLAGLFLVFGFVFTLVTLPVEKAANKKALEIMKATNIMDAEEQYEIAQVFKSFEIKYVLDFVIAVLEIIRFILQVILALMKRK